MVIHPHLVEEDKEVAGDIRTAREVAKMGSSISDMIQLTWDCPSNNNNGKMAMLNTEVWVEGNKVWYEHYRKPMANDLLMLEISAMGFLKCSYQTLFPSTQTSVFSIAILLLLLFEGQSHV